MSRNLLALTALTLGAIGSAAAQTTAPKTDTSAKATPLAAVTVTATRNPRSTFDTPQPTTVIDSLALREKLPNGIADVFRDYAGLDASGVGPNQRRPEIRLQRGQRILVLEDGLRLNNSRRQQDFGELPALAGSDLQQVEVVRGPSSVLYGTDALGGVVNLISRGVPRTGATGDVHGFFNLRYGTAGSQVNPDGALTARFGNLGVRLNGTYREAQPYKAPGGSFGDITLPRETQVFDTGIRDRSYRASLGYDLTPTSQLYARGEQYVAENAGFGWIDPTYTDGAKVQIVYPDQQYTRFTAGYHADALSNLFTNRVDVSVYTQGNRRHFNTFVLVPAGPGATVDSRSYNFTNLATVGGRVELAKAIGLRHTLTYGVDAFRDRSDNRDSSRTILTGFGPTPIEQASTRPSVPNAFFQSAGAFAQLELNPIDRLTTVLGARYQDVSAETRETAGLTAPLANAHDRTTVWTVNGLYRLTSELNVVATLGRGFRAPNLVERFFSGSAAEGNGFQSPNPDLTAETSLNTDLGMRFARGVVYAEGFVFRNDIHNAIKAVPTGNTVQGQPEYQPRNIDRLRVDGLELTTGARFLDGFNASANFTRLLGKNVSDPGNPIGDSYSSKLVGDLSYRQPSGRFSAGYTARFQGEQKDVIIGSNPIGTKIPSFVVHSARASVRLFDRNGTSNSLLFKVDNIANTLYAEFPNASFFRPEAGRNVSLALQTSF
jgi:outer membrane receptor protein involved in Fe transport